MQARSAILAIAFACSSFSALAAAGDDPDAAVSSEGGPAIIAAPAANSLVGVSGWVGRRDHRRSPMQGPVANQDAGDFDALASVIGTDDRSRVTATNVYPARAVVAITFEDKRCTGFLINANTVATAGHCVHTGRRTGRWYDRATYRIYPGRNGAQTPYGSCGAKSLHSVNAWLRNGNRNHDYGAIKLDCSIGDTVGWLGFWWQPQTLNAAETTVTGYPTDMPANTLWESRDSVRLTRNVRLFYQNDTGPGMMGSPVWRVRPAGSEHCVGPCVMAIHNRDVGGSGAYRTHNSGQRITRAVFNNFIRWRNLP
jgi:glutamyl endopeptidase